jgi:hypothetical protein
MAETENKLFQSAVGRLSIDKYQFIALYAWNNVAVLAEVKTAETALRSPKIMYKCLTR